MSDTATPPAPAPAPRPRRGPPAPDLPPTPPGPVAGNLIGPSKKADTAPDMPPGIPAHIAQGLRRPGVGAARAPVPTVPERPLHPTFAGPNAAARQLRQRAEQLRATAQSSANQLISLTTGLKAQIEALKATPEGLAAAANEGLDLELLSSFTRCLDHALQLTEPPTPKA